MLAQVAQTATTGRRPDGADAALINGRNLAFKAIGSGSPSVIFETGLGAEADEWEHVQRTVAEHSATLRYDRAGRGASDPARPGRDAYTLVDDLHELVHKARVPAPYILVGHSLGGLLMRVFAQRHRDEVAGIVLVDSMHEDQFDLFGPTFPPPRPDDPAELIDLRHFWTGGWRESDATDEAINLPEAIRQGREVSNLGDLPLHVITAGTFLNAPFVPPSRRDGLQSMWEVLQSNFLRLSSRGEQSFVRDCGHFVQRERPDAIVQAILDLQQSA